uniref:Uncharacterized protein n=1 Tax=Anguilla anguilla TaxID=7936 RepID=A0A0E9WSF1_ANGAN
MKPNSSEAYLFCFITISWLHQRSVPFSVSTSATEWCILYDSLITPFLSQFFIINHRL